MRFKRKKDLKEQIRELQSIIHIQEQGRKLRTQASEEAVRKNRDLISFLRTTLRAEMHELNLGLKYDQVTISRACLDRKRVKIALAEYTVEQARESLSQRVFDRMNTHNILLYEVKRRGNRLEELQVTLQDLIDLEMASPELQLQLQTVRQLENNFEKMQVNIVTADKVHHLYVKMLDVLRAVSPVLWPSSAGSLLACRGFWCWVLIQTSVLMPGVCVHPGCSTGRTSLLEAFPGGYRKAAAHSLCGLSKREEMNARREGGPVPLSSCFSSSPDGCAGDKGASSPPAPCCFQNLFLPAGTFSASFRPERLGAPGGHLPDGAAGDGPDGHGYAGSHGGCQDGHDQCRKRVNCREEVQGELAQHPEETDRADPREGHRREAPTDASPARHGLPCPDDARRNKGAQLAAIGVETTWGSSALPGTKLEASKAQIEYQGLVTSEVEKIKSAVQCSHLWDIAGRFMAQKKSEENLQQQIAKSEKKRRGLKSQLKALELQRAELKFHQSPGFLSSKTLEENLWKNLEEEEERLSRVRSQASKNQELLLHFENGIDNLILRLWDISVPGQEGFPKMEDVFEKLQFCETKLLHLSRRMLDVPSDKFIPDESDETFVHLRNFLEESARDDPQNLRITFDEDEEDVREAFNFADIDHSYVPSREEIKKEALKLIEEKTKVIKKKQRGAKK